MIDPDALHDAARTVHPTLCRAYAEAKASGSNTAHALMRAWYGADTAQMVIEAGKDPERRESAIRWWKESTGLAATHRTLNAAWDHLPNPVPSTARS